MVAEHKVEVMHERREGGVVAHVVFDNARRLNVLDPPALADLIRAVGDISRTPAPNAWPSRRVRELFRCCAGFSPRRGAPRATNDEDGRRPPSKAGGGSCDTRGFS